MHVLWHTISYTYDRIATQRKYYGLPKVSSLCQGHPAYCAKLREEGALVTRLEDRYSYWYQQINRFS